MRTSRQIPMLALIATLIMLLASALPAQARRLGRVGIAPTLNAADQRIVTRIVKKQKPKRLVTGRKLRRALAKLKKAGLKCGAADHECMIKLGIFARLDQVFVVEVNEESVRAVLLDVSSAKVLGEASTVGSGKSRALLRGVVTQALRGASRIGFIVLDPPFDDDENGVVLALNDAPIKASAAGEIGPLRAGTYRLTVAKGDAIAKTKVTVSVGKRVVAAFDLSPPQLKAFSSSPHSFTTQNGADASEVEAGGATAPATLLTAGSTLPATSNDEAAAGEATGESAVSIRAESQAESQVLDSAATSEDAPSLLGLAGLGLLGAGAIVVVIAAIAGTGSAAVYAFGGGVAPATARNGAWWVAFSSLFVAGGGLGILTFGTTATLISSMTE